MKARQFELVKAKLEGYAEMAVQERLNFFGMCALDSLQEDNDMEYFDIDFPWVINADTAASNAVAQFRHRGKDEIEGIFESFCIWHFNSEIYYIGTPDNSFVDLVEDGICTKEQEEELRAASNKAVELGIERYWCASDEIVEHCLKHFQEQSDFMDGMKKQFGFQ